MTPKQCIAIMAASMFTYYEHRLIVSSGYIPPDQRDKLRDDAMGDAIARAKDLYKATMEDTEYLE